MSSSFLFWLEELLVGVEASWIVLADDFEVERSGEQSRRERSLS